jgi:hypothetical protein
MDSGDEIPGLNEDWSFLGANAMEWMSGLAMFMIVSQFTGSVGTRMPLLLVVWIVTTVSMSGLRKKFPDEQRGVMNQVATWCGFAPPGIPAPSSIQPVWSGAPVRELKKTCEFETLGLYGVFFRDVDLEGDEGERSSPGKSAH